MNICHYDWFNKQADWPIAEQDKVRWESQTENDGMRLSGVRSHQSDAEGAGDECAMLIKVPPCGRAEIRNMG